MHTVYTNDVWRLPSDVCIGYCMHYSPETSRVINYTQWLCFSLLLGSVDSVDILIQHGWMHHVVYEHLVPIWHSNIA